MGILSRPKFYPQERLDLEDVNALLAALRTDSKLYTKQLLSAKNLIYKGFSVTGIGLKQATVNMADATFIIPQNTNDFSWFTSSPTEPNVTIPDADLIDGVRNYIEIQLLTEDNTPVNKAFWDPDDNSGEGAEFNEIVDTMTDLTVKFVVSTGGFTGDPDRIPVCIIDTDGSGVIKSIFDRRNLFGRLATPINIDNRYSWGTKVEPVYTMTMTGVVGTFTDGEEITIGSETAKVVTGGTTSITFNVPTGINFTNGDSVTGSDSGATGLINTVFESFSGVDKSLGCQKDINDALMTEIALVKGSRFWWENPKASLNGIIRFLESVMTQNTAKAAFGWDGTELSITDDSVTPAQGDVLGFIRVLGTNQSLELTRQDGQGGTNPIAIADGEVVFVKLPITGDRTFDGVGTADDNFQISTVEGYQSSDENYWIAFRQGTRLYIRGYGELEPGEEVNIGDPELEDILAAIAANQNKANQDRNFKLIEGGTWSVDYTGNVLTLSQDAYIQIPGLDQERNTISSQNITLPNPTSIAYVTVVRSGSGANVLSVTVDDEDAISLTDNDVVIARKTSQGVIVGTHSFLLKAGEYLENDGALAEINRYMGQLKLKRHETNVSKTRINAADSALLNGNTLSQMVGNFLLDFTGAVINFTDGTINKEDDSTPLGSNFTPFSIPTGQYFWYGISLVPGTTTLDNRQTATVQVDSADSAQPVLADAPKPTISGQIKLGAVLVQNIGGTITVVDVRPLGVGSGSGSGGGISKVTFHDPLSTTLPTGSSVMIDNVAGQNGDLVLFTNLNTNNNRVYQLGGVGTSITWTPYRLFNGNLDPLASDMVIVSKGDGFKQSVGVFDGTDFSFNYIKRYFNGADYVEQSSIHTVALADNQTDQDIFSVNVTGSENWLIPYSIVRGGKESGILMVSTDGTDVTVSGPASEVSPCGVSFSGVIITGVLHLRYSSTSTGAAGSMKFFYNRWSDGSGGPAGVPNYSGAPSVSGTVTSVALSLPSIFNVTGSPITTSGTLAAALVNQAANTVFAGPATGIPATPGFRALVAADIPGLDASKIITGLLSPDRGGTGIDAGLTANLVLTTDGAGGYILAPVTAQAVGNQGDIQIAGVGSAVDSDPSFNYNKSTKILKLSDLSMTGMQEPVTLLDNQSSDQPLFVIPYAMAKSCIMDYSFERASGFNLEQDSGDAVSSSQLGDTDTLVVWQSIVPTSNYKVSRLSVRMNKDASAYGHFRIQLYTVVAGQLTTMLATSRLIDIATEVNTSVAEVDVVLNNVSSLMTGIEYAIAIVPESDYFDSVNDGFNAYVEHGNTASGEFSGVIGGYDGATYAPLAGTDTMSALIYSTTGLDTFVGSAFLSNNGFNCSIVEDGGGLGITGIVLNAIFDVNGDMEVNYQSSNTGFNAIMKYSLRMWN